MEHHWPQNGARDVYINPSIVYFNVVRNRTIQSATDISSIALLDVIVILSSLDNESDWIVIGC